MDLIIINIKIFNYIQVLGVNNYKNRKFYIMKLNCIKVKVCLYFMYIYLLVVGKQVSQGLVIIDL